MIFIILILVLLILSVIDEKSRMVPEGLSLLVILIGLLIGTFTNTANTAIYGLAIGILSVWVLNQTPIIKLGGGDAKVIGMIGAWCGWIISLETLTLSIIIYKFFFNPNRQTAFVPIIFEAFLIISFGVLVCQIVKLL